ncbi:MAG: dTDP-glucose 4,6-dehydratase [Omnitrophica WOR_2 bacterium RIFOXYB2_FULL_38_16]|nr:MAG: dTDP-glucose 4,6-dehydratase [Omnitrophica WOR_2 bacterium RIFOXYA2_FULL_38_17]OGX55529.1 MAG: dTDP-glucose 4,6-dehydratase [Omnitrophica WOR_2 bacterium RIFOXYB2_FULL_38_16]HBG62319.1 dTDP-glucose 4,6-dehydratase [Candidatus Omnitrophota bacterium]
MAKILITGGCGFIGSNFIRYYLKRHDDVEIVNFDKLTYAGKKKNLSDVEDDRRYSFVKGDVAVMSQVKEVMEGIDSVVHFAAESHVDRSIIDPGIFIQTNITGTYNLLECARENGVRKLIHISTDEVYGSLGAEGSFTENSPLLPNSPYSASKASSDLLVRSYCNTFGLPAVICRCSNNYGPYQFTEKLIPLTITNAMNDKLLPVYGDGLQSRDWIYVEDQCRALDAVLMSGRNGEIYNIGGNCEWANIDVVKLILDILNKPHSLIEHVKDRLGHDRRYALDSTKIKNELDWKPLVDFQDGIERTVAWYGNL